MINPEETNEGLPANTRRMSGRVRKVVEYGSSSSDEDQILTERKPERVSKRVTKPGKLYSSWKEGEELTRPVGMMRQFITESTPAPKFSSLVIEQLNKPTHERKYRPILAECRQFIMKHTGTTYLTKKEYTTFAQKMVTLYPKLASRKGPTNYDVFKGKLSASLREHRRGEKEKRNKSLGKTRKRSMLLDTTKLESWDEPETTSEDARFDQELRNTDIRERRKMGFLLKKTLPFRLQQHMSHQDMLKTYPHLKVSDFMVQDFLFRKGIDITSTEKNFQETCLKLGNFYKMPHESNMHQMALILKVHDYFLSRLVEEGAKPLCLISDEKDGVQHLLLDLLSTEEHAPFLVGLSRTDFTTGNMELRTTALVVENELLCVQESPAADKALLTLLAAYSVLNIEYPPAYVQFMRAVERLLTGDVAPSKYGQSTEKYDKFVSIIEK